MENILLGEHLKTQLQFYVYKPEVNSEKIPSNFVRHQNVMIRKKKWNKEIKEGSLETEDVSLIQEADYVPLSTRIQEAENIHQTSALSNGVLRA